MAAPLGLAVLGYAHGHVTAYSHQIKTFDDARLVACWDHDEQRGRQSAEGFGIDFSPHLEDIVGRGDVQAVIIGAETNRHADCCVAAAEAGLDIILQKPMALSLEDCDRIIAAVERAGVRFTMAYQMRLDPMNQKIRELVHGGAVGRVGFVRRRHCIPVLFNEGFINGPSRWHIDPLANMGMFMDDASHAIDFLIWIWGQPISAMAEIDNVLTDAAPDDTGAAIFRWPSGMMGSLLNASVTWAGENTCEVYGDEGVIIQNHDDSPSTECKPPHPVGLKLWTKATRQWELFDFELPAGHGARISNVARACVDWLKAGGEPLCTMHEGRQCIEVILACYQSSATGRRVTLPLG